MFSYPGMGMGCVMVPVIKSDTTIVRRTADKQGTMSTHYDGASFGLIGAVENVLEGDRDIDHAIIKIYTEEEAWDGYGENWGMC